MLGSFGGGRGQAQAHAGCSAKPQTLAAMRGCYRPLVVLARSGEDARVREQQRLLDAAADDLRDRNVLYIPGWQPTLDAPYTVLPPAELDGLRKQFHASSDDFLVLLLGEDGGAKLQSRKPITADRLNSLIDAMPTRKLEMRRAHSKEPLRAVQAPRE